MIWRKGWNLIWCLFVNCNRMMLSVFNIGLYVCNVIYIVFKEEFCLFWIICFFLLFVLCIKIVCFVVCIVFFFFREFVVVLCLFWFVDLLRDVVVSEVFIWGFCGEVFWGRVLWRMMFFIVFGWFEDVFWWKGWFLDVEWCFIGLWRCVVDF